LAPADSRVVVKGGIEVERDTFDRLVRLFGTLGSRRGALRLAVAGALLGRAAPLEDAAAKRRRSNRTSRNRGSVQAQAEPVCQPVVCRPGIVCPGKTLGPGKNLARCEFIGQNFVGANLSGANISRAVFLASFFSERPNFRGANAGGACFAGTTLTFADFRGTNLSGASFMTADIRGADFRGSNVTADQLACASGIDCATILPNGKPAVPCAAGQTCVEGSCTCQQSSDCPPPSPDCTSACVNGLCICEI
jgi:hypothetical protein